MNSHWIRYLPASISKTLDSHRNAQKIAVNTGWLMADRVLRIATSVVLSVWIARHLGPDQFGSLNYATAFVALFGAFATLGLDGIVVRELVRNPGHRSEILGAAFTLRFCGGCLTLLLAIAVIPLLRPQDSNVHLMVGLIAAGTILQSLDVIDFWFQSRVESRFSVYAKSTAFLLASAVKALLILNNAPLWTFAAAASLEFALSGVGLITMYRVKGQHFSAWRIRAGRLRQLLHDCWPLALSGLAVMVYMKIDQIMLGQMLGNHEVGVYGAAIRFSEVWYFIPISLVASFSPALIESGSNNRELYHKRLSQLFRLLMAIALSIAIPITLVSGYVARIAYGPGYEGVETVLAIHIWAMPFVFLGVAQSPWSINEGLTRLALFRAVSGAIANVILNLLLIPRYGPAGAAFATTVSYALSAVVLNAFSSRTREIFRLQINSMFMLPVKK